DCPAGDPCGLGQLSQRGIGYALFYEYLFRRIQDAVAGFLRCFLGSPYHQLVSAALPNWRYKKFQQVCTLPTFLYVSKLRRLQLGRLSPVPSSRGFSEPAYPKVLTGVSSARLAFACGARRCCRIGSGCARRVPEVFIQPGAWGDAAGGGDRCNRQSARSSSYLRIRRTDI